MCFLPVWVIDTEINERTFKLRPIFISDVVLTLEFYATLHCFRTEGELMPMLYYPSCTYAILCILPSPTHYLNADLCL